MSITSMFMLMLCVVLVAADAISKEAAEALEAFHNGDSSWKKGSSSRTTTSSSDSNSANSRIAAAVEAALREANAETQVETPTSNVPYEKFRLRLSTTNKQNSCATFKCTEVTSVCAGAGVAALENAVATVATDAGDFNAIFDAAGTAASLSDAIDFSVVFDGCNGFTLNTVAGDLGVNVTSLTLSTQKPSGGVAGAVYFDSIGPAGDFDVVTLANADNTVTAANAGSAVGCDDSFDGFGSAGASEVVVTPTGDASVLVNNDDVLTVTFALNAVYSIVLDNAADVEQLLDIGLEALPCAGRDRIVYDEIAIVTLRQAPASAPMAAELLKNPTLFDALSQVGATPSFDNFIFQLQQAASRTQIRLRDATLDSGAFSTLSHDSKFTNCFRVWPEADFQIQAFIGMRGANGDSVVRAKLQNGNEGPDLVQLISVENGQNVYGFLNIDDLSRSELPQFEVEELAFGNLRNTEANPIRPFESLRSDVSVFLERCPTFSYFE